MTRSSPWESMGPVSSCDSLVPLPDFLGPISKVGDDSYIRKSGSMNSAWYGKHRAHMNGECLVAEVAKMEDVKGGGEVLSKKHVPLP